MAKVIVIDPPSGWMYGFPKVYNREQGEDLVSWLMKKGYPQKDALWASENSRYWEEDID